MKAHIPAYTKGIYGKLIRVPFVSFTPSPKILQGAPTGLPNQRYKETPPQYRSRGAGTLRANPPPPSSAYHALWWSKTG